MNHIKTISTRFLTLVLLFAPLVAFAQEPIVPCGGADCTYSDLIVLLERLIRNFVLFVFGPLVTVAIMYMGFLFVVKDQAEARTKAKKILWNIVIGTFFVLGAWLIVNIIVSALVDPSVVDIPLGN